jgi:ankyrin repeat protein
MQQGNRELVIQLLDSKRFGDINGHTELGETPLHCAAMHNFPAALSKLFAQGANAGIRTQKEGLFPIHIACERGYYECLVELTASGLLINSETPFHFTPLHYAAQNSIKCVRHLLTLPGLQQTTRDASGNIPAVKAIKSGRYDIYAVLDPTFTNSEFRCFLEQRYGVQILPYTEPRNSSRSMSFVDELVESLDSGVIGLVKTIIHKIQQMSVEIKKDDFLKIIGAACNNGNLELLELLSRIIDLNETNVVSVAIGHGLVQWMSHFEKYGISVPAKVLIDGVRTNKKAMMKAMTEECEMFDSAVIVEALELTIDLEFDDIFSELVSSLKNPRYSSVSLAADFLSRSLKVQPFHVQKFREISSSSISLRAIARNSSDDLINS